MSEAEKKIGLSLRAAADDEEKNRLEDYQRQAPAATTTIEEVMSLKERERRIACKFAWNQAILRFRKRLTPRRMR